MSHSAASFVTCLESEILPLPGVLHRHGERALPAWEAAPRPALLAEGEGTLWQSTRWDCSKIGTAAGARKGSASPAHTCQRQKSLPGLQYQKDSLKIVSSIGVSEQHCCFIPASSTSLHFLNFYRAERYIYIGFSPLNNKFSNS